MSRTIQYILPLNRDELEAKINLKMNDMQEIITEIISTSMAITHMEKEFLVPMLNRMGLSISGDNKIAKINDQVIYSLYLDKLIQHFELNKKDAKFILRSILKKETINEKQKT